MSGERTFRGRTVYSKGPIVRALEVLSAFSSIAAIAAIIVAVLAYGGRIDEVQASRFDSLLTQCQDTRARNQATIRALKTGPTSANGRALIAKEAAVLHVPVAALQSLSKASVPQTVALINALVPARKDCAVYARRLSALPSNGH